MLKSALRKYCIETGNDWDDGVPLVLFAVHEARQTRLGLVRQNWCSGIMYVEMLEDEFLVTGLSEKTNVLDFVSSTC